MAADTYGILTLYCTSISSQNVLNNPMKWILLSFQFYRWENWGLEKLSSFSSDRLWLELRPSNSRVHVGLILLSTWVWNERELPSHTDVSVVCGVEDERQITLTYNSGKQVLQEPHSIDIMGAQYIHFLPSMVLISTQVNKRQYKTQRGILYGNQDEAIFALFRMLRKH